MITIKISSKAPLHTYIKILQLLKIPVRRLPTNIKWLKSQLVEVRRLNPVHLFWTHSSLLKVVTLTQVHLPQQTHWVWPPVRRCNTGWLLDVVTKMKTFCGLAVVQNPPVPPSFKMHLDGWQPGRTRGVECLVDWRRREEEERRVTPGRNERRKRQTETSLLFNSTFNMMKTRPCTIHRCSEYNTYFTICTQTMVLDWFRPFKMQSRTKNQN